MKKEEKIQIVTGLIDQLSKSPNVYLTDFTGLSVKNMTELRKRFRQGGAQFVVVKNSLALRALQETSLEGLEDVLNGPTGFVFTGSDALAAAKVLTDFQREGGEKPVIKAGLVDGKRVGVDEIKRLAALPSRDALMGQMAGALQAPLQGLVGALNGLLYQMVGALEALRAQRGEAA